MDTVVDFVGSEKANAEDCTTSNMSADPIVYQLVRVDGNGRLVPATEDEVMAVEDLLEIDKSNDTPDTLFEPCGSNKVQFEGSEGQPKLEDLEIGAEKPSMLPDPEMDCGEIDAQHEDRTPSLVPNASDSSVCQSGSAEGCSKLSGGLYENKTSKSAIGTGLNPDFSLLNGEVHLDSLGVKELQDTFKATFGRETSVKDKQWLKRRIIMGLTNSCDFSTTSFVIIDNRVVKKGKEEACKSMDSSVLVDCVVTSLRESHGSPPTCHDNQNENHSIVDGMKAQSSTFQDNYESEDANTNQRPTKRVRKPTKRYIEELSEGESQDSGAKVVSSVKHPSYDQLSGEPITSSEGCKPYTEKKRIQLEKEVKSKNMESSYKTSSDDDVATITTANGGIRRKHHRPWTLSEVVKLVEGVAKYGAGRWSEIKRLAFASYSYRTSVDLKDKWRNLLRASLAELPTGNGMQNSRKQVSVPIPAPILSRVRELADIHSHNDSHNRSVHVT
ncbi:hypothetical protein MIMGU_mgv1a005063mg [Erythranthe guttata]|uniref:Uncharacterized protein n=1 Tax=Erythranthe guttata TaxID=4155 RepID=A0A022S0U5_ERYGU|nr:hypothetical protein MIMGU_mgv1a005063mg [Erythranthe guttata]